MSHREGEPRRRSNREFGVEHWRPRAVVRAAAFVGGTAATTAAPWLAVSDREDGWWFYALSSLGMGIWALHFAIFAKIDVSGDEIRVAGSFIQKTIRLRRVTGASADRYGITVVYRGGEIETGIATRLPFMPWESRADAICVEIMRRAREARKT